MGRNRRDRSTPTPRRIDPIVDLVRDPVLPVPRPLPILRGLDQARALIQRPIQDGRSWHPMGRQRPIGAVRREARRVRVAPAQASRLYPPRGLKFSIPDMVDKCIRRKVRRMVIFAKRKAGKGSKARRRRDAYSHIGC